jgi:predicted ATPase
MTMQPGLLPGEKTLTNLIIVTGGPGAGKTTTLGELASRGYRHTDDVARAVIRERLTAGLSPRPEPSEFAKTILAREIAQYEQHTGSDRPVFFDRSIIDALGGLHGAGTLSDSDLTEHLERYRYNKRVFVFPPWIDIYTTDDERDHTFEHAERVYASTTRWHARCGYEVVDVPIGSVESRADFMEQRIADLI